MDNQKTVFMTGASGHMGRAGLDRLVKRKELKLKLFSLPDRQSRRILAPYADHDNVEIIEGDLTRYDHVLKGVRGADFILHLGAIIPPAADYYPDLAMKVNYGGTQNIIKAIKAQDNADDIRFVFIGTVASMGDRRAPVHWVRTGDPIKISLFDTYGKSKVMAERAVIESGLSHWVSLRQTGMLHKDLLSTRDPIIYHQPLNNPMEWATAEDSGRILETLCTADLPREFWQSLYNIGGGEEFRDTYYGFMEKSFKALGIPDFRRITSPNFFTLKNFHGCWYSDSDKLEKWLGFRKSTYAGFFESVRDNLPAFYKLGRLFPSQFMKKIILEPLARTTQGTLKWIKEKNIEKIEAYWGSLENWLKIPGSWGKFILNSSLETTEISHGYDDNKCDKLIDINDCRQSALFREAIA
jgi:nucleoside-diphosphate-sugar epimerase